MTIKRFCVATVVLVIIVACGGPPPVPTTGPGEPPPSVERLSTSDYDTFTRLLRRFEEGKPLPHPLFALHEPGDSAPLDYTRFGTFSGVGTSSYRYEMTDQSGLAAAAGEGVFPNQFAYQRDPVYLVMLRAGAVSNDHWAAFDAADPRVAFYSWVGAGEDPGVRAFFTGMILERAGLPVQALKSYYAAVVHFPGAACWGEGGGYVWYIAPAAIASIERICRDYPETGWTLEGANVSIKNGGDTDLENDVVTADPGRWVRVTGEERERRRIDLSRLAVAEVRGRGKVQLVKYENGHWEMRVEGRPFIIRSITYSPTEIGVGPKSHAAFHVRWMRTDRNGNGLIDAPQESWVDANGNGRQDRNEPPVGDFQLLEEMGVNAIRMNSATRPGTTEYDSSCINKPLLREMFAKHGIRVVMGDNVGAYTHGSGADWRTGTDYTNPEQRARMKEIVRRMVMDLKDEPFILMWVLGNENNMSGDYTGVNATRTNAAREPRAYAEFLNEVATMIHELDPDHPVAVGNVETGLGDAYNLYAPALDIFGINSYRGPQGFGDVFRQAKAVFDRPVFITEYGCDCYHQGRGSDRAMEEYQAAYNEACLRDIVFNQAGGGYVGNCIGSQIFEFLDEWWKDTHSGDPESAHRTEGQFWMPFSDKLSHEEWFGIVGQGSGKNSPFERRLRKTYFFYKDCWTL